MFRFTPSKSIQAKFATAMSFISTLLQHITGPLGAATAWPATSNGKTQRAGRFAANHSGSQRRQEAPSFLDCACVSVHVGTWRGPNWNQLFHWDVLEQGQSAALAWQGESERHREKCRDGRERERWKKVRLMQRVSVWCSEERQWWIWLFLRRLWWRFDVFCTSPGRQMWSDRQGDSSLTGGAHHHQPSCKRTSLWKADYTQWIITGANTDKVFSSFLFSTLWPRYELYGSDAQEDVISAFSVLKYLLFS